MKKGLENALVSHIKQSFLAKVSEPLSQLLEHELFPNTRSLSELLLAIQQFPQILQAIQEEEKKTLFWEKTDEELNQDSSLKEQYQKLQKKYTDFQQEYLSFRDQFSLSFAELKTALEQNTPPINLDNLNTKPFSKWSEAQQKTFDTLFTKLVTQRLKTKVHEVKTLTQEVGDLFSKPLPLACLCSKFPCSYEELQQRAAVNNHLETLEIIKSCEQRRSAGEESAEAEMEQLYRQLYLETIKEQNPRLAAALAFLYEHDFDFSALEQDKELKADFFHSLAQSRIEQMEKAWVLELFSPYQEQFKQFFLALWNPSKEEFELNGLCLSIKKTIRPWTHLRLKSLAEFSGFWALPLDFSIEILNFSELNIETVQIIKQLFGNVSLNREIKLSDDEVGKVIALFIAMQPKLLQQHDFDSEDAKKLAQFFSTADEQLKIDKLKKTLNQEENQSEEDSETLQQAEESPEERKKQFLEAWKSVRGENAEDQDGWCRGWAVLYCSRIESLLPPNNDSHEWTKLEISNVNREKETISFRPRGTELKLGDELENKSLTFSLKDFKDNFLTEEKLLDKPFKFLTRDDCFETTLKKMQAYGLCDEKVFGDAQLENWKLMLRELNNNGEEIIEEVKYFGSWLGELDDNKALYEVKWQKNGMLKLSSEGLLDKKWKVISYEQTMSYSDFLLFLNEKKLIPKTEKIAKREKEEFIKDIESRKTSGGLRWISIHSLVFSVKNIWKKINEGLDNYQKDQDQDCLDWLTQDIGIYKKLEHALGWIAPSLKDSFAKLHDDEINRLEKDTWKEIEEWITIFGGIEFADVFETGFDPASGSRVSKLDKALWKRWTLKNILISRHCVINDNTLKPIMAAAMISNLKEGKGLYRWMPEYDNQGLWVQCLFGKEHYGRFLQYKRMIQEDIDRGWSDADQLRDLLVKSEINYIVYNIQNSHGKDKYLGSVTDKDPVKNAPRQILKKAYSNKFAGQLNEAAEQMTGQGAIENSYSKAKKMNTFDVAHKEFEKCIKSGRIESGLWVLQRMGELKKTKEQGYILAASMSYVTMSGIIDKYAGKDTIERFDGLARSLMLPTAFFADKAFHQHYAWHILNQVPVEPKFSKAMKAKNLTESKFTKSSAEVPYWDLRKYLPGWWLKNAEAIDNFFLSLKTKDHSSDPILNKVKEVLWEQNPDNLNPSWRGKPKITWHYALNQTPATIEQNKSYSKSGFDGKDEDERNDKAAFWKTLLGSLENVEKDPDVKPEFFLKQFKTWFSRDGFSDANDVENISMLRTIAKASKDVWKESITFEDSEYNIEFKVKAHTQKDVKNLIWYLFEGKVLKQGSCQPPVEFKKVLDFFVDYFTKHLGEICSDEVMKKVFDTGALEADDAKAGSFVNWKEYNSVIGKDDNVFAPPTEELDSTQKSKDAKQEEKRIKAWKRRYYKQDPFINRGLVDMEKHLRRINVAPPKLLSAGAGHITSS